MAYVTGAAILDHVQVAAPTAEDTAWAATVAAAIEGYIAYRLDDVTIAPGSAAEDEIIRAALDDGAAAYARRKAPHGILTMGPDGQAVRLGKDIAIALRPVLARRGSIGIG